MNKPTLYILCGLPFSGKTTLVSKLSKSLRYPIVSIDDIRFERGFEWSNKPLSDTQWKDIFEESYNRTLSYLKEGKSVLYDSANQDRASRNRLKAVVVSDKFPAKVILLDVDVEVVRKRWLKNQSAKEQKRFHIPKIFFQQALDAFERPTEDENVVIYNQSMDLKQWINENF